MAFAGHSAAAAKAAARAGTILPFLNTSYQDSNENSCYNGRHKNGRPVHKSTSQIFSERDVVVNTPSRYLFLRKRR